MILPLLVALASPAPIQDASAVGIVADPCVGAPTMSASVSAYLRSLFHPTTPPTPAPAADMAAYQAAQVEAAKRDFANLCRYRADNARLAAPPRAARRVVYIGDSITEGWALADPAMFADGRIGRGISGQTTPQMLLRFMADVVALRPARVHIMAGTNDIAGNTGPVTLADIERNIAAMTTLAKANGIAVTLASVPPAARFPWRPELKPAPQIAALNAWLRDHARAIGARYVDYHAVLARPDGAMRPELTFDGVHPNAAGYAAMRALSVAATAQR